MAKKTSVIRKMVSGLLAAAIMLCGCGTVQADERGSVEANTMVLTMDGNIQTLYLESTREVDYKNSMELSYIGYDASGVPNIKCAMRLILGIEPGTYVSGDKKSRTYFGDESNMRIDLYTYLPLSEEWEHKYYAYETESYSYRSNKRYYDTYGEFGVRMDYRSDDWKSYCGVFTANLETYSNFENETQIVESAYFDFTLGEQHEETLEVNEMEERLDVLVGGEDYELESESSGFYYPGSGKSEVDSIDDFYEFEDFYGYYEEDSYEEYSSLNDCFNCGGNQKCDDCNGTGEHRFDEYEQCYTCWGTGRCIYCDPNF